MYRDANSITWLQKLRRCAPVRKTVDPVLQTDAILKVTSTCICGSDLHLYLGFVPGMEPGIIQPTTAWCSSPCDASRCQRVLSACKKEGE